MKQRNMWMVRAQRGGQLFDEFEEHSLVAIGWELGDMGPLRARDDFVREVASCYPDKSPGQVAVSAGQVYRFVREFKTGDRVLTYSPEDRKYLVGTLTSEYEYAPGVIKDNPHIRHVSWQGTVPRDSLSIAARNSLGAISTIFLVPDEVSEEIESLLAGREAPEPAVVATVEEEISQVDELLKDVQSKAFEFIKDRITRLDWEEMQELVAGLLRAMGYKTRISPSGSDRGKDIVASPDGFGFESPRIVVEVKHRTGSAMGSQEIRSFLGGRHKDDKGLYVSTGGFSKDARYEADRANIPLTLMDLDDLVKAILDHYETMDADSQRLIPLRKVYWPG
ncbi:MAG TPA: restriction endonuclease [Rhodanobacteraceae bacterium]|nr:restriction endonuclease [Rhodanobacteraceae bacterium]